MHIFHLSLAAILLAIPLRLAAADPRPTLPPEDGDTYQFVWGDEFDGSQLDLEKWYYRPGVRYLSQNFPGNISVGDGQMRIALKKEKAGKLDYTAGGIISKREFKYGYFEARFRIPPGAGWHTSFWLMKDQFNKAASPAVGARQELDICEQDSVVRTRYAYNLHVHRPVHVGLAGARVETPDLSADFHVWGGEFTPAEVRFYFDGKLVGTKDASYFAHDAMHLWLTSIAVNWTEDEKVDDSQLPASADFDYVRVFENPQRVAAARQLGKQPGPEGETKARDGLPNVAARLAKGEPVRVAYLGGSITEWKGWRVLSKGWLQMQYPSAEISEIDAAISGTGSDFGAYRVGEQVLAQKPDLLFVEFAVNDGSAPPARIAQAMEGIVRQTWQANPETDICFVYAVAQSFLKTIDAGQLPPSIAAMERVAEHYHLPSVHFGLEVAKLAREGKLTFTGPLPTTVDARAAAAEHIVFSPDGVHPYPTTGHPLYLASLRRGWPKMTTSPEALAHSLPPPLDPLNWENARLIPVGKITREGPWERLPAKSPPIESAGHPDLTMWSATEPGAALTFTFRGSGFGLYGLKGPDAGTFRVTVDDQSPVTGALFDAWCTAGRWRVMPWFYPHPLEDREHRVRIELTATAPEKARIIAARTKAPVEADDFAAKKLTVSEIMIRGALVK